MKISETVFVNLSERIDAFAHKRYSSPEVHKYRNIVLKAKILDTRGNEFKAELFGNNGFEKDGQVFVFHKGDIISEPSHDIGDRLGKWEEY